MEKLPDSLEKLSVNGNNNASGIPEGIKKWLKESDNVKLLAIPNLTRLEKVFEGVFPEKELGDIVWERLNNGKNTFKISGLMMPERKHIIWGNHIDETYSNVKGKAFVALATTLGKEFESMKLHEQDEWRKILRVIHDHIKSVKTVNFFNEASTDPDEIDLREKDFNEEGRKLGINVEYDARPWGEPGK